MVIYDNTYVNSLWDTAWKSVRAGHGLVFHTLTKADTEYSTTLTLPLEKKQMGS